jgi:hypothetical protein
MEKTIWKFELEVTDNQTISMPKDAEILSIQIQDGKPVIWVLVNPEEDEEPRVFDMFGTGHPIPTGFGINRNFIGTVQIVQKIHEMYDRWLAFHVFERY